MCYSLLVVCNGPQAQILGMMGLDNSILEATGILFNMSNEVEFSRLLAAKHPEVSTLPSVVLLDNPSPRGK